MARSQETFNKKEREKKKKKKRQEKLLKKQERRDDNNKGVAFEDMLAYVDENGHLVDTPVDPSKKKKIDASSIEIGVPKREEEEYDPIFEGKLVYFKEDKGYGFIKDLNSEEKYFVHINNFIDDIQEMDKVNFEIEKGPRGFNAVRVKKWKKKEEKPKETPEEKSKDKSSDEEE